MTSQTKQAGAADAAHKPYRDVRDMYRRITESLIAKRLTVSSMESCTSGQIASLITDTEGSSAVLRGAFITYSNEAKIQCGVPEEIIRKYSVYSEETAGAMAEACAEAYQADIGIGVTGTMGNIDPENAADSVPGNLYYAVCFRGRTDTYHVKLKAMSSRYAYKMAAAGEVGRTLLKTLEMIPAS